MNSIASYNEKQVKQVTGISFLFIKLITSIFAVVLLTEISKRVSPHFAGLLMGLPLGVGLSFYFISYREGIDFTIRAVPWGIAGLSASLVFSLSYLLAARFIPWNNRILSILCASILSLGLYLAYSAWLHSLSLGLSGALVIFTVAFLLNLFLINRLVAVQETTNPSKSKPLHVLFRSIAVGAILLVITEAASLAGSKWAGVLSGFPLFLFPLLLILHFEHGQNLFPKVIRSFSYSITTLIVFYFSFMFTAPLYGLNIGFTVTYILCLVYLYLFEKIKNTYTTRRSHSKTRHTQG